MILIFHPGWNPFAHGTDFTLIDKKRLAQGLAATMVETFTLTYRRDV